MLEVAVHRWDRRDRVPSRARAGRCSSRDRPARTGTSGRRRAGGGLPISGIRRAAGAAQPRTARPARWRGSFLRPHRSCRHRRNRPGWPTANSPGRSCPVATADASASWICPTPSTSTLRMPSVKAERGWHDCGSGPRFGRRCGSPARRCPSRSTRSLMATVSMPVSFGACLSRRRPISGAAARHPVRLVRRGGRRVSRHSDIHAARRRASSGCAGGRSVAGRDHRRPGVTPRPASTPARGCQRRRIHARGPICCSRPARQNPMAPQRGVGFRRPPHPGSTT